MLSYFSLPSKLPVMMQTVKHYFLENNVLSRAYKARNPSALQRTYYRVISSPGFVRSHWRLRIVTVLNDSVKEKILPL